MNKIFPELFHGVFLKLTESSKTDILGQSFDAAVVIDQFTGLFFLFDHCSRHVGWQLSPPIPS
jgi:hypothetical protein